MTGEMWKNKPPFGLAMNKAMSDDVAWHYQHYTRRGGMTFTSLVLKLAWVVYHLDSLCRPCFLVFLASQHQCP